MNIERLEHIIVGTAQLLIAFAALLQVLGVIPEHSQGSQLLITILAAISGTHHVREGSNGVKP